MASVVTLWSKTGDFSNAVDEFPGVITKVAFDLLTGADDFYGTAGDHLIDDTVGYVASSGQLTLSSTTGLTVGMYVYAQPTEVGNDDGYYEISTILSGTEIIIDNSALDEIATLTVDDAIVTITIGGVSDAFDSDVPLQAELDFIGPACGATSGNAINNLDILCHGSVATLLAAAIDPDALSGSTTTRVRMLGTNSSFVEDGTKLTVTAGVGLTTDIFDWDPLTDYFEISNFVFDGDSNATNGISNPADGVLNPAITNCDFVNLTTGISVRSTSIWVLTGCTFTSLTTGYDVTANSRGHVRMFNCVFDSCTLGMDLFGPTSMLDNCLIVNGTRGIQVNKSVILTMSNTVVYGHSSHGVELLESNGDIFVSISNSDISQNGGFGIKFNASTGNTIFEVLLNNNFFSNTSGITDFGDGSLEAIRSRLSITSDPLYTNDAIITGFIPTSSSPLIDAGVGGTGDTIGSKCAAAGGAGGGVNPLTGLIVS